MVNKKKVRRRRLRRQLDLLSPKKNGRRGRPKKEGAGVSHLRRAGFKGVLPVHVTMKVLPHVWRLRRPDCFRPLRAAFLAAGVRFGMRLISFSVQGNHIHALVEAQDKEALSRGMQGMAVRMAWGLNRVMGRRGTVFADRYHAHLLRTPREVRRAIDYVNDNSRKHAAEWGETYSRDYVDPYSSAA